MGQEITNNQHSSLPDENQKQTYRYRSLSSVLLPYFSKLWIVRRKLLIVNSIVLFLTIAYQLIFVDPYFDSAITIYPDYGSKSLGMSGLGGLAAIAGVSLGESATQVDIYQNLLSSESVIEPVLFNEYQTQKFPNPVNLFEYYQIENNKKLSTDLQQRDKFNKLYKIMTRSVIRTKTDPLTKILTLNVRMPESQLSSEVANELVKSLDEYTRTKRKSNAAIQRSYLEKRSSEIKDSMTVAEDELKNFQSVNKVINQSPDLLLRQSRLLLQVQILQSVYSQLIQQLELSKIEEIKDAPIINVREWARDPVQKSGPSRLLSVIIIFIISIFVTSLKYLFFDQFQGYIRRIINNNNFVQ